MYLLSIGLNVIIISAIFHFIYQSIILPTRRERISYKLFALRDDVRLLAYNQKGELNDELIEYLESTINNSINCLPLINFKLLADAQKIVSKNIHLQEIIEKNKELLKKYATDDILLLEKKKRKILIETLLCNTFGSLVYIVPAVIFTKVLFGTFSKLKQSIGTFGSIPEEQCKGELTKNRNYGFV